jgi:type IV pilus assembly protein PilE
MRNNSALCAATSAAARPPRRSCGFTLIELLVTVVIISIVAAIALPSYADYVIRGKIPDATAGLATRQVQMEQYFQDNQTYVGAPACTSDSTSSNYFTFACASSSATAYQLNATGSGTMSGFTFTVDQSNVKTMAAVPSGWSAHSPNNCWVTKKGGVC